jgi:ATP-binding cassette subfamily F protein 3
MVELAADRLVLVDQGTAKNFDGSMEDYIDFVLGRNQPKNDDKAGKSNDTPKRKSGTVAHGELKALRRKVTETETRMTKLQKQLAALDAALLDPASATGDLKGLAIGAIGERHAKASAELEEAEMAWLEASEAMETVMGS